MKISTQSSDDGFPGNSGRGGWGKQFLPDKTGCLVDNRDSSFDEIVKKYKDLIFNLLYRLTGDFHLSEDLFQETFLRAFRGLSEFSGRAKVSSWLYSIALNVFRDHVKKRRWRLLKAEEASANRTDRIGHMETPENQLIQAEEQMAVQRQLNELKPGLRIPVVLFYIEGFRIRDIAEITGRSESDIKVSLHRARAILRRGIVENDERIRISG
jgi:RNA polymerase sigma-70 factor (ECF subfamily)